MLKSKNNRFYLIFVIHLIIALGFYIENLNANYSSLSSDLQNIIPVAQKFDNPELFKKDLYVNDINNVKYYTPFFVQPLRFIAKFTNGDYVQVINILNTICHLLFGILWFYLIYRFIPDFWIALIVSFVIRGIVWLPGLEIWGIADLWAMMPRTLYITLFPIPFLVINLRLNRLVISGFLIGLIFNFHPITGLGGILLYVSFIILMLFFYKIKDLLNTKNILIIVIAIAIGMLPFIITYFGKTSSTVVYNMDAFLEAFNTRIPRLFFEPLTFLKHWLTFKTLFYVIPIVLYYLVTIKNKRENTQARLIIILTLILIVLPSVSVYVEQAINNLFNLNFRLSFQLIRSQKVAIIPSFFAIAFLLNHFKKKIENKCFLPVLASVYFVILIVCKLEVFNSVPFVGDDLSRYVLPNNLSLGSNYKAEKKDSDKMAEYISVNTDQEAVLFGSHVYRAATKRSVVLDPKGASMLIEGNPSRFIQWRKDQKRVGEAKSIKDIIAILKSLEVNYIVSRNENYAIELTAIHTEGNISLYKIQ
ncbi:hypothetical protein [uncultured Lacinutrix sp.]|uniref:hypothetical protein n=1 Tax=uncultured Lacinutrix sp. TaxID=574032 RepID=UPI00263480D8|nr:hypothetical protein [uncultured Lacinutrix sp.]